MDNNSKLNTLLLELDFGSPERGEKRRLSHSQENRILVTHRSNREGGKNEGGKNRNVRRWLAIRNNKGGGNDSEKTPGIGKKVNISSDQGTLIKRTDWAGVEEGCLTKKRRQLLTGMVQGKETLVADEGPRKGK